MSDYTHTPTTAFTDLLTDPVDAPPTAMDDTAKSANGKFTTSAQGGCHATTPDGSAAPVLDRLIGDLDRHDDIARTIGEALRLAGVIEAIGVERIVDGSQAEYDLGVRLHDLIERLAFYGGEGDAAAELVHDYLTPVMSRLEGAAMNDAIGRVDALIADGCPTGAGRSA